MSRQATAEMPGAETRPVALPRGLRWRVAAVAAAALLLGVPHWRCGGACGAAGGRLGPGTQRSIRTSLSGMLVAPVGGPAFAAEANGASPVESPAAEGATPGTASRIWFGDLDRPLPVELVGGAPGGANGLERLLRSALEQAGTAPAELPEGIRDDRAPRIVFLAAGDGATETPVCLGRGFGILAAVADAARQAREAGAGGGPVRWGRLDVVGAATAIPPEERVTTRLRLRHRTEGIAFEGTSAVALSPGELVGRRLIDASGMLGWTRVLAYLRWRQPAAVATQLRPAYRFTTVAAAADGARMVTLEDGLPPVHPEDPAALLEAARLGGRYLATSLGEDGRFTYRYQADTGTVPRGYNIVRHAGTVYALLELYEATHDAPTLAAAERALGFLLRQIRRVKPVKPAEPRNAAAPGTPAAPARAPGNARPGVSEGPSGTQVPSAGLVEDGEIKLGGNALAVVALAKHAAVTGSREHESIAVALGDWMLAAQDQDGRFAVHQQTYPGGRRVGFESQYYPGEAILALVRLHILLPAQDSRPWLDAAERGARWLITVRDGDLPDGALPHDHWLLYALNELQRLRPDPIFLTHARRLARAIVASQHRTPAVAGWRGGYYEPPRTTPTATRSEGLAAAYALLRDSAASRRSEAAGAPDAALAAEAGAILEAVRLGVGFQLRTQIVAPTAINLPRPDRALGGFHNTLDDYEVRIDYVQHNISSLLALARILRR